MASTHKHIRSSTANKRPTTAIADGQIALNTNATSPGLFFKDSTGATIIKIGPVHVGSTAPNATPGAGGSAGNSSGEVWLDNSLTPVGVKIWDGSAWVNATPAGSTTVQGLLELATNAETQAGTDPDRAVTPAGLQSKLSDSTSTTSATTIASSTAVKSAYDLANAALPKSGGTITGNLEIGTTGSLSFEGSTADAFETTIAVTDPTADRTITLPDTTGTIVTTGDTGTVTSTMIADGTIVNADINSAAAIAHSKLAALTSANILLGNASNVATSTAVTGDVTISNAGVTAIASGVIVNADVNASAAIAGTKISPDFGSQNVVTTGTSTAASLIPTSSSVPTNGVYLPAANTVGVATNGTGRLFINSSGSVGVGTSSVSAKLQVNQNTDSGTALSVVSASANTGLTSDYASLFLQNTNTTNNNYNTIGFINDQGGYSAGIHGIYTSHTAGSQSGAIAFGTSNAGSYSEKLRITSAGLVGIGTTSPTSARLDVREDTNYPIRWGSTSAQFGELTYDTNAAAIRGTSGNALILGANGGENARIDTSGRLLVGTSTAPGAGELLRVEKASTGTDGAGIRFGGTYSIADGVTQTFTVGNGCLVFISENVTGDGALFFCGYRSATVTLISDPNSRYANSDTATKICVFKSANTGTVSLKNRSGSTGSFTIGKINNSD